MGLCRGSRIRIDWVVRMGFSIGLIYSVGLVQDLLELECLVRLQRDVVLVPTGSAASLVTLFAPRAHEGQVEYRPSLFR